MRVYAVLFLSFGSALFAGPIRAAEVVVPTDFPSIQSAIDSISDGDSIRVLPGTYAELIDFRGKGVHIFSDAGPASTIIDGTGLGGSVVSFKSGEGPDSIIEGFTITGGSGTGVTLAQGGGIYGLDTSPTIRGNRIVDNEAIQGGGIFFENDLAVPAPLISGNTIEGNLARRQNNDTKGAGACLIGCAAIVKGNAFEGNRAQSPGEGGGIFVGFNGSRTLLEGNTFLDNFAYSSGGGIHMQSGDDDIVRGNVIRENATSFVFGVGGGIGGKPLDWYG